MNKTEKTYNKEFDLWNVKKKIIEEKNSLKFFYFHEREVWWCSVGINIGVEIDGKNNDFERPVLVIKKFNGMMFWGIPLTSKSKIHPYVLEVRHEKGISFANLAQLRLFSSKRVLRKIGMIDADSFNRILVQLKILLIKNRTPQVEGFSEAEATNAWIVT